MAPRTRATASTAPQPLAAAPRRRVKVTPLDAEEPTKTIKANELAKPATRSTRSKPASTEEPAPKSTAVKSKGRPKKNEAVVEEQTSTEQPSRVTRSTRATSTTVSSEAREKSVARSRKAGAQEKPVLVANSESEPKQDKEQATRAAPRKKVTFQETEDDKENQPLTRAAKKTAASKSAKAASAASGLRAKPVRKPVATTSRSTKRSKEPTSDDEEDHKPKRIQRVLTPKKITQVARVATPVEASEDELLSGKTPVRDLSLSPRRPQTNNTAAAIAKTLSPAKKLDFGQSLLQSAKKDANNNPETILMSPARRPARSPSKLFSHSTVKSPVKVFNDEANNTLASPARRPAMSPIKERVEGSTVKLNGDASKLLFPTARKHGHQVSFTQGTNNLSQSPKRSAVFDPSRIFAHSAIKPQQKDLSKSNFFSSPAKRVGQFSPLKRSTTPQSATTQQPIDASSPDELDLDEMEVTSLINDGTIETTASSHQRASVSPLRPLRVIDDELQDELDDSILPVRSPMKLAKSPLKAAIIEQSAPQPVEPVVDEDITEAMTSVQSTPHIMSQVETSFVSLQALENGDGPKLKDINVDLTMVDIGDDTIILPRNDVAATPRTNLYDPNDTSPDVLAVSAGEDVIAKFVRMPGNTPRTPATLNEHELTNILSSPETKNDSPASLHEHELTMMASSPTIAHVSLTANQPKPAIESSPVQSPAGLHEHELTTLASVATPKDPASPASLYEHEMTMMGQSGTPSKAKPSPASIAEHELTRLGADKTTRAQQSPASIAEHELTMMAVESSPRAPTPTASVDEHELTLMGQTSPGRNLHEENDQTPVPAATKPVTFTPDLPIPRKFNLNTVVTKVPLKPEGQDSPFKLNIKKRKRPLSLGGQPDSESIEIPDRPTPTKQARTVSSPNATDSTRVTPAATPANKTPASNVSRRTATVNSARRVASTPTPRTPLTPVVDTTTNILTSATVYVDVRTSEGADASAIYIDLLSNLGASIIKEWKESSPLTHIIYKDGNPKTLEKIRLAAADGRDIKCVGVSWPLDCDAQRAWVDETSYLVKLTSTDHAIGSMTKSARRKSMEPSTLIADGTGSVKRSRSRSRVSMGARKSIVSTTVQTTPCAGPTSSTPVTTTHKCTTVDVTTPSVNTARRQADKEKLSLTAAWKSINAPQNLGEDTPARKTLELLQRSYAAEADWDSTILTTESSPSNHSNDENTPRPTTTARDVDDDTIMDTGLTPAPYRTQQQVGSAPSKVNVGLMSYRERVEEMERREMRDGSKGVKGGQRGKEGRRVTIFGNL
ncbi:hypothetical protein H2198_010277 [Neophaeococcomyces mojaviensis]|uniref:Uncharacterized protein n=1 Tax=Neophaeococcomyces mojaviensis TaxID=3383035 RepID=A0ACC2ZS36_9EURO|nr:hypothetical protein H2198_010277 [Knufia sp. JES_112]